MKKIYKSLLLGIIFTLGVACVHYGDRVKEELDPWIGKHPDQLVEQWGAPDSTYSMANGVKVLSYASDRTVSRYSGMSYTPWRFGNYSYTDSCKISFFTDAAQKKLERYSTQGDSGSCFEVMRDYAKTSQ
jgi:hypothetical protein